MSCSCAPCSTGIDQMFKIHSCQTKINAQPGELISTGDGSQDGLEAGHTLNSGSTSVVGAGLVGASACAVADNRRQLEGGCAQEDDEQQVEDGGQEGAHKVAGDAAVGASSGVVEHVEGVALVLHINDTYGQMPLEMKRFSITSVVKHWRWQAGHKQGKP